MSIPNATDAVCSVIETYRNKYRKNRAITVAVMVSGGMDSMVLAKIVLSLKADQHLIPVLVYVNFTDFPEHEKTTKLVLDFAEQNKVPLMVYDPEGYNDTKTSARDAMKSAGMSIDADLILTGHHADDQIETFLFRSFRGTGINGLACMQPLSEFNNLTRNQTKVFGKPFLNLFKEDLFKETDGLVFIHDSSNEDCTPNRNYIRNKIVPKITCRFQKKKILATINAINEHLESQENSSQFKKVDCYKGYWELDTFLGLPVMNRVFLIRHYLSKVHGYNLNRKTVLGLKESFYKDLTDLNHQISSTISVIRDKDLIRVVVNPAETQEILTDS